MGFGQGHRLDSSSSDRRPYARRRSDLGLNYGSAAATIHGIRLGTLSVPLANRTALQTAQVASASRHAALSPRPHGKELDAGAPSGSRAGATARPALRSTFPLGLPNAA